MSPFPALAADLRVHAFGVGAPPRPRRVGAEAELLAVCAETRAPVPITAEEGLASLPLLRRFGAPRGWREEPTPYGAPRFVLPDGGVVTYEPGGQVELSTRPYPSATGVLEALRATVLPLREAARDAGIELLTLGIDPHTPVEEAPLRLHGERYARMAEYFARIGPAGARMMRQTASFQLNLDWEGETAARWWVLNAAAPYLTAIFASSGTYAGGPAGHRSFRAHAWRELDPARTGVFACAAEPAEEYLAFALAAPVVLRPSPEGEHLPAGEWLVRGELQPGEWRTHLTTLFPEVRPHGHAEVRSMDAMAPEWYAAPVVLLSGLLYHPAALREAAELLGAPDAALLREAGRVGMGDPEIARVAGELFEVGLRGAEALGEGWVAGGEREAAREFWLRYTRAGLSPADDLRSAALC